MERKGRWGNIDPKKFISLAKRGLNASGHNVFVQGYGYLSDHVTPNQRRDRPDHWNSQFQNIEAFQKSWQPRNGPLELVDNLAQNKEGNEPFYVLNIGAGLGDFTVNLAQIPKVHVAHVDFSAEANRVASKLFEGQGVGQQVDVVTARNIDFLKRPIKEGSHPDFIFLYGGLGENTPQEKTIERTLKLAAKALAPGGHIWYVGLVQLFLEEGNDQLVADDILGEYPTRPDLIPEIMSKIPYMYLVKDEVGERPDRHPLVPGGEPQDHMHIILRALFAKTDNSRRVNTPPFGFKDAIDPEWQNRWAQITKT